MAEILDSLVVTLDEADSSSDVDLTIEFDDELNVYSGESVTSFYRDEPIYLLVQAPPGYNLALANFSVTAGGVVKLGPATRTEEVTSMFFEDDSEKSLTWYPSTTLTVTDDHDRIGTPVLTVEDKKVTSNIYPVVVDFTYNYTAYSIKVSHPSGLELTEDETYELGLVVEVVK